MRKDAALLDSNRFNVTRRSATIASISFVMIVPLVFEFRDELSAVLRLEDAMYAHGRMQTCKETEDLPV